MTAYPPQKPEWRPHDYQLRAAEFVVGSGSGQLWLDPGLGKTSIVLQCIKTLKKVGAIKRVLIIAPMRVAYSVWPAEIEKWANFEGMTISIVHGPKAKRVAEDVDIHVTNFESIQWLAKHFKGKPLPWDMLVVDEISHLRSVGSVRFKALETMLDQFKRRFGLTGSPAPNSLLDVFGPQLIIDRGATFGKWRSHFRSKYFMQADLMGYDWRLQNDGAQRIYDALAHKVIQMRAEDYLKMPEIMINDVVIDLPEAAMNAYISMERNLIAMLREGDASAVSAGVALGKCRQIANGGVYLDGLERAVEHIHRVKTDTVQELVEELNGSPALVVYHFQHDLMRLKEAFPNAPILGSGVSGDALLDIVTRWNRGEISVLLCHAQSVSHGLNLQDGGHTVIWHSLTYSFEQYDQLNRRLYRQGQKRNVMVHRIIARNTVDEDMVASLARKHSTQASLIDAIRQRHSI